MRKMVGVLLIGIALSGTAGGTTKEDVRALFDRFGKGAVIE